MAYFLAAKKGSTFEENRADALVILGNRTAALNLRPVDGGSWVKFLIINGRFIGNRLSGGVRKSNRKKQSHQSPLRVTLME